MKPALVRGLLFAALGILYLLHNDLWFWDDPRLVAGMPVGLVYHVLYCVACAALMWLVAGFAWPEGLDGPVPAEEPAPPTSEEPGAP